MYYSLNDCTTETRKVRSVHKNLSPPVLGLAEEKNGFDRFEKESKSGSKDAVGGGCPKGNEYRKVPW